MASPPSAFFSFLLLLGIFAMASSSLETCPKYCECPCRNEINLHLYLHQFVAGDDKPNRNEDIVITSTREHAFGATVVHDWILTNTTNPRDTVIARVEGVHIQSGRTRANRWYTSQIVVFEQGSRFAGSTLQVMGLSPGEEQGEWSIVGGTGEFRLAQGIIKFKEDRPSSTAEDGIKELDINVIYTPTTAPQSAAGITTYVA